MYSRNLAGRSNGKKINLPPRYDGSRFANTTSEGVYISEKAVSGKVFPEKSFSEKVISESVRSPRRAPSEKVKVEAAPVEKGSAHYDFSQEVFSFDREGALSPAKELLFDDTVDEIPTMSEFSVVGTSAEVADTVVSGVPDGKDERSNVFSELSSLMGKNKFSYEDMLIVGLILLMSSSENGEGGGNDDMLIILALLLAYKS